MSFSDADLGNALAQCAVFAADHPWGSDDFLFALVPTAELAAQAPDLVDPADDTALSPVLQETGETPTEELLPSLSWPHPVAGCALVTEITIVPPPGAEGEQAAELTARLIAGALRNGKRLAMLSLAPQPGEPDGPGELRTHPDLAPELLEALLQTLAS